MSSITNIANFIKSAKFVITSFIFILFTIALITATSKADGEVTPSTSANALRSVSFQPNHATQNQDVTITLKGSNTNWIEGYTTLSFSDGTNDRNSIVEGFSDTEPIPVTVTDQTTASLNIKVKGDAAGLYKIKIQSSGNTQEETVGQFKFEIKPKKRLASGFIFLGVVITLWGTGFIVAARSGYLYPLLPFIVGADNRLSLSRTQASIWTLVIFGSYVVAMFASEKVTWDKWISIPTEVLTLTGISIATGVISSAIASNKSEEKVADITGAEVDTSGTNWKITVLGENFANKGLLRVGGKRWYSLRGEGIFKWDDQRVTFYISPIPKDDDKIVILVDTPNGKVARNFEVIRTTEPQSIFLKMGNYKTVYEPRDLFSDDKDPSLLSLMKYQMFGWTIIAVTMYIYLFFKYLTIDITDLPTVNSTIVILTGISNGAYLSGKGTGKA